MIWESLSHKILISLGFCSETKFLGYTLPFTCSRCYALQFELLNLRLLLFSITIFEIWRTLFFLLYLFLILMSEQMIYIWLGPIFLMKLTAFWDFILELRPLHNLSVFMLIIQTLSCPIFDLRNVHSYLLAFYVCMTLTLV